MSSKGPKSEPALDGMAALGYGRWVIWVWVGSTFWTRVVYGMMVEYLLVLLGYGDRGVGTHGGSYGMGVVDMGNLGMMVLMGSSGIGNGEWVVCKMGIVEDLWLGWILGSGYCSTKGPPWGHMGWRSVKMVRMVYGDRGRCQIVGVLYWYMIPLWGLNRDTWIAIWDCMGADKWYKLLKQVIDQIGKVGGRP
ncbi:hypothetical protein G9A89_000383 [Geosiphon pyriformis]|nr:hypothetical protein G9A89_000383 [Geosiphon pyriformis]